MGRIKRAICNLSIKKTFMLYMLLFLLLATLLSAITINVADNVKTTINLYYADSNNQDTLNNDKGSAAIATPYAKYSSKDIHTINICSLIEASSIPVYFGLCIIASALLFYRNKLKKPIELLNGASKKIAGNDLNFKLSYDSKDEMGRLCTSFESMRTALLENNRELWRTIEERKRLNAVFSHDMRTPLTVLRGYTDFLKAYVPQGKISKQKLLSTISTMSGQIARLESYVQTMGEVQKLEDIDVLPKPVQSVSFVEQIMNSAQVLTRKVGHNFDFENEILDSEVWMDSSIVQRVTDNLLSNAVQYAKDTVIVRCRYENATLSITVEDDGQGFTREDLKQAAKPYYRNKTSAGEMHFGLGLFICKSLCEKHGGQLKIRNGKNGGACVTASFLCRAE